MHHSLGMGKRPLSCLGEGNQYTEHKTFGVGSEHSQEMPGCPTPGSLWHCRSTR